MLLPRFVWADTLAVHYSHFYRSAYVLAYLLSAAAVFVALVGVTVRHTEDPQVMLMLFELLAIGFIMTIVWLGHRWHWHERWLEYRALAERLRHGRFLAFVSEFGRIHEAAPRPGMREMPWMLWYVRATMREIGLPTALLGSTYQWRLLDATLELRDRGRRGTARLSHCEPQKLAPDGPRAAPPGDGPDRGVVRRARPFSWPSIRFDLFSHSDAKQTLVAIKPYLVFGTVSVLLVRRGARGHPRARRLRRLRGAFRAHDRAARIAQARLS